MSVNAAAPETATAATEGLPGELETPTAKLVYLAIDTAGGATVDDLRERLDTKKIVLYETLRTLDRAGLVESTDRVWTTR